MLLMQEPNGSVGANFLKLKPDHSSAVDYGCKCCENPRRPDASPVREDCLRSIH